MIDFSYDKEKLKQIDNVVIEIINDDNIQSASFKSQVEDFNPYEFDPSRYLPNAYALTLDRFVEVANSLIKDAEEREGKTNLITLTEEYPPEPFDSFGDEVITWKVVSREPGKMDAKAVSRPQRASTYSHEMRTPQEPNKVITIESRPVDHVIEFCCWAKTNKLANKRAIWLEKLLINNAFVFTLSGAERFYWKDRKTDTYMTVGNQRLFYRQLHFFLRFREFEAKAETILREILIKSSVSK